MSHMVILCHAKTAQQNPYYYEEGEHCPDGSLVDFDKVKSALCVGYEVLRPLLIRYLLNVPACGRLANPGAGCL